MKSNLKIAFIVLCALQLFLLGKMLFDANRAILLGEEYKFECRPIDPTDPLKGKYITLDFKVDHFFTNDTTEHYRRKILYATLEKDEKGFARFSSLLEEEPSSGDYCKAYFKRDSNRNYQEGKFKRRITLDFDFDIFYMEESKAPLAENVVRNSARDLEIYAKAKVFKGEVIIEDVLINGVSIGQHVIENME